MNIFSWPKSSTDPDLINEELHVQL